MDNSLLLPALVFCVVQVVAAIVLALAFYFRRCWRGCTQPTVSTVVEMRIVSTGRSPVFRYRIADGRVLTCRHKISSDFSKYRVGMQVPLLYDAAKPTRFVVAQNGSPYKLIFYMFLALTILTSLMGCVIPFVLYVTSNG